MNLSEFQQEKRRALVKDVLRNAAALLTDPEIEVLCHELSRTSANDAIAAFNAVAGHEGERPLTRLSVLFKDAPLHHYSGLLLFTVLRDWKANKGVPPSAAEIAELGPLVGVQAGKEAFANVDGETTWEGKSNQVKGAFAQMWESATKDLAPVVGLAIGSAVSGYLGRYAKMGQVGVKVLKGAGAVAGAVAGGELTK